MKRRAFFRLLALGTTVASLWPWKVTPRRRYIIPILYKRPIVTLADFRQAEFYAFHCRPPRSPGHPMDAAIARLKRFSAQPADAQSSGPLRSPTGWTHTSDADAQRIVDRINADV